MDFCEWEAGVILVISVREVWCHMLPMFIYSLLGIYTKSLDLAIKGGGYSTHVVAIICCSQCSFNYWWILPLFFPSKCNYSRLSLILISPPVDTKVCLQYSVVSESVIGGKPPQNQTKRTINSWLDSCSFNMFQQLSLSSLCSGILGLCAT